MNFIFWGIFILPGVVSTLDNSCSEIEGWVCTYNNLDTNWDRIDCADIDPGYNHLLLSQILKACKDKINNHRFDVVIHGETEKSVISSGFTLDAIEGFIWKPEYLILNNIFLVEVEYCATVIDVTCTNCETYKIKRGLPMDCLKKLDLEHFWRETSQYTVYHSESKKESVNDDNCYAFCNENNCGWRASDENCHNFATKTSCQSFCDKHNCKILLDTNTIDCTANCPNNCPNTTPCSTCPALTTSIPTTITPEIKKDDEELTKTLRVSLLTVILVLTIVIALLHIFPDKHEQVLQETPQQEENQQENDQQAFEYESYYEDPNLFRS